MEKIGKYNVERLLGQGAMGKVFLARDPLIGRAVAIKMLSMAGIPQGAEAEVRARFLREAQAAGSLNHPNIVTIYDIDTTPEGEAFIAMELVEGRTLKQVLKEGGRLDPARASRIAEQVAAGLAYAHARGIVHRDVKPDNIMVADGDVVKIMDFGVAKLGGSELTHTGQSLGTPAYMSPEQVKGDVADARSDLFSLGVIYYEMLAGERPFTGENITTIAHKIVYAQPAPILEKNPALGAPTAAVVERLLRKDSAARYPSGDALAADLQAVRAGRAPAAVPAGIEAADGTMVDAAPGAAGTTSPGTLVNASNELTAAVGRPPAAPASSTGRTARVLMILAALALIGSAGLFAGWKWWKGRAAQQQQAAAGEPDNAGGSAQDPGANNDKATPEPAPEPEPEPVKDPEPAKEPEKPKPAPAKGETATVDMMFEYQGSKGNFEVTVDGETVWATGFEPRYTKKGKRFRVAVGVKETVLQKTTQWPAGERRVHVRVHSADVGATDNDERIVTVEPGGHHTLYIRLRSISKDADFSFR